MRFKTFYKEVATTTVSMGGTSAQHASKVGILQKREGKVCKYCGKGNIDGKIWVTERRKNGDSWHRGCEK